MFVKMIWLSLLFTICWRTNVTNALSPVANLKSVYALSAFGDRSDLFIMYNPTWAICWRLLLAAGGTRVDGVSAGGRADVQRSSAAGSASWDSEQLACQRGVPLARRRGPKVRRRLMSWWGDQRPLNSFYYWTLTIINTAWLVSHRRDTVSLACAYKRKEWVYRGGWEEMNVDTERQIKCDGEFVLKWKIPCLLLINVSGFIVRDSSAQVNIDVCFNNFLCVS